MTSALNTSHKLVLHPADPDYAPENPGTLRDALHELGLLGDRLADDSGELYFTGENFLELITFLGCSPVVNLGPGSSVEAGNEPFCQVRIGTVESVTRFYAGSDRLVPRCPACRYRISSWAEIIKDWEQSPSAYRWSCPQCSGQLQAHQLNWRQSAGFGRFFMEIYGVFPHEAVPGEQLLATLARITGVQWSYFYSERLSGSPAAT
jgi:hypothetical protein